MRWSLCFGANINFCSSACGSFTEARKRDSSVKTCQLWPPSGAHPQENYWQQTRKKTCLPAQIQYIIIHLPLLSYKEKSGVTPHRTVQTNQIETTSAKRDCAGFIPYYAACTELPGRYHSERNIYCFVHLNAVKQKWSALTCTRPSVQLWWQVSKRWRGPRPQ